MDAKRLFFPLVGGSLVLVALLLGIAGFAAIHAIDEQDRSFELVTDTYDLKDVMAVLVTNLREVRTAQRAYIETGNPRDLAQFRSIRTEGSLNRLMNISRGEEQHRLALEFVAQYQERYNDFRRIVELRARGDIAGATAEFANTRGSGQTTLITRMAEEMTSLSDKSLSLNIARTRRANSEAKTLVVAGLVLSILVIAFSAVSIMLHLRRRRSAERALRHKSALLQDSLNFQNALVDSAAYGIIASDAEGKVTEFNRTAEQMLRYSSADVVDKLTVDKFYDPKELTNRAVELSEQTGTAILPGFPTVAALPRLGQVEEREWTYICKDGRRIPVHVSMTAISGDQARISGYLSIARDISELRKVARLKNEFVATVSHELRTPLTSIRGSLGLVLGTFGGELSAQIKGLLQIAHNNAERLGRLINDILDVEKIESGKMEFKLRRQPLAPLLQQAIDSTQGFARQFNVTIQPFDNAHDAEVDVDGDRFIQVIVNLLSNAAKFSPAHHVVTITAERHGRMIRVSVADKGKGIPAEFQNRVFEKFAQADSSDARQKSGTGLGLSITKTIVEKMNGLIGFDTQDGAGTTFYVDLPEMAPAEALERRAPWGEGLRTAS